ncbi:MAG: WYL domain-containing protein [Oscillospiraceae bacterium]|nr:WYL domain-containing protein [Oscillospiraceae bacterium]
MLFHEVYGSYFRVLEQILTHAVKGDLTGSLLTRLVQEKAFAESGLSIPGHLVSGSWPLVDANYGTPLRHVPTQPLTTLQKRWLKALLLDPRMALFAPNTEGLEDVESLFSPDSFVYFDRYADGDPYDDPTYIACFHLVLQALREKRKLRVRFRGHTGIRHSIVCVPVRLEYSPKDDKFRLLTAGDNRRHVINLARVRSCEVLDAYAPEEVKAAKPKKQELTVRLVDERNALERVMLHFSHLEKETVRLDEGTYQMTLHYDKEDETELLIRILSFGPVLQVTAPDSFISLIRERLARQKIVQIG